MKNNTSSLKQNIIALFFLTLAIFLLYSNTFQVPFTYDDAQIVDNYFIRLSSITFENLKNVTELSPNKNRLLPNFSFALNYYFDGFNPSGFHLVNIILHIAVAFSFYILARVVLEQPVIAHYYQRKEEISFVAAILWAVHPLQTNAVTYIVQRMTSMAALFTILTLIIYMRARTSNQNKLKVPLYLCAIIFGVMALLSKENSGMLPLLIIGIEFFLFKQKNNMGYNKKKFAISLGLFLLFTIICLHYLGSNPIQTILNSYIHREFDLSQRLLTQSRVITHYLSLLVLPMPARLNLMYDFQLSNGLLIPPQTLFAILVLLAMGLFIILLAPKNRLAAFAVFWFLANLLVESSVIPLEIIFEHRMYVPSMFLILAAVSWVYWFLDTRINGARIAIIFLVVILSVITWQRNKIWQNEISLWTDVVKKNPYLVKGYVNLGNAFGKNGDDVQAEMYYRKAIALKPNDEKAYLNLGTALKSQKRYEEALSSYSRAVALGSGNSVQLHNNLSHLYMELQQYSEAVQHAQEALKIDRYNYNAIFNLGTAYFKSGKFKQAQSVFLNALELYPDNSDFYLRLGATFENQGKLQEAIESLNKVIELHDTNLARAYNMLGIIYWRQKKYDDSVASAKKSLAIDPGLLDAYVTLGITYEEMGYQDMAFDQFRKAWQQGLDMVGLFNSWALNFLRMNNPDKAILYLQEAINLQPDHIASHENLGIAFQKKGMLKEAQIEKNKARQLQEH